ncbi:hypothetical protein A3K63_02180 [Candidatus Micrarchaeota archaeon RBG_16_49_10]|nr:MAG: hypothetical protein A3K63_02180 [Candidatus Micrarchaeota archaeon RBG_16_49_10]
MYARSLPQQIATDLGRLTKATPAEETAISETLKNPGLSTLDYGHKDPFRGAAISYSYRYCCGLALIGDNIIGLSHYNENEDPKRGNPKVYVPSLAGKMRGKSQEVSAVIMGGDGEHLESIVDVLDGLGIPLVGGFADGWAINEKSQYTKALIVMPQMRSVYMVLVDTFLSLGKYFRLTP